MTDPRATPASRDGSSFRARCARISGLVLAMVAPVVVLVLLSAAGPARADSLVFTKPDGNIYLANPDGSDQYQVTLEGTPSDPYFSPSETASGVIEAGHGTGGSGSIVQLAQNGTPLISPFATAATDGPLNPVISPDGKLVAYWASVVYNSCPPFDCPDLNSVQLVSNAGQYADPSTLIHEGTSFNHGVWLSDTRLLLFAHNGTLWLYDIGAPEPVEWGGLDGFTGSWFTNTLPFFFEGAASGDGTRLAVVTGIGNIESPAYDTVDIELFSTAGDLTTAAQPASPTPECTIAAPDGSDGYLGDPSSQDYLFSNVTWSRDGQSLAFAYNGAIYVAHIPDLSDCATIIVSKVIASGSSPFWSSASIDPAPRPAPQPTPNPHPTPKPNPHSPVLAFVGFPHTGRLFRVSGANALVALTCTGRGTCRGTVTIQSAASRPPGRKLRVTTYAAGAYSVRARKTRTIRLQLSRAGRFAARTHRTMFVWINVSIARSTAVLTHRVKVRF
jgi:hypothetical protein